jgi:hypothetical protein
MSLAAYKNTADALRKEAQDEITKVTSLLTRIKTFVRETSVSDITDIVDPDSDMTEKMRDAVEAAQAFTDNPLMNAIDAEFSEAFGISTTSVLSIAQSLIRGDEPPMLRVIIAFVTMPSRVTSFIAAATEVKEQMEKLQNILDSSVPGGTDLQRAATVSIPPDIIQAIESARNNLVRSMSFPFNTKLYVDNMEEIYDAAEALERVEWTKKRGESILGMMTLLTLNSMAVGVAPVGRLVASMGDRVIQDINVIMTTDLNAYTASSAKYNTAKKAVARVSQVLSQMKSADVDQLTLLPKYITILNVAYMLLKTGKPAPDLNPLTLDRTRIRLQVATVRSIQSSVRKMVVFLQSPYKISALQAEIGRLRASIDALQTEYNLTMQYIVELENDPSWAEKFNLVRLLFEYLEDYAMATSFLADGYVSSFLELNELTATAEGAVTSALLELANVCDQVFLPKKAQYFRKKAAEVSKKMKAKSLKVEAKKEKRSSKAMAKIKELNKIVEDVTELYATMSGVAATVAQLVGDR